MKLLLVSAYPESGSFGGQLKEKLAENLREQGNRVLVSDLYQHEFPAVSFPSSFKSRSNPDFFDLQEEQRHALKINALPNIIQEEQQKIREADVVIFLCPVYWSSPPAIMRGWIEQVLTPGFAYDKDRVFETGLLKGKSAFFVATFAGKLGAATPARTAAKMQALLNPLEDRPLHYSGFDTFPALTVRPPFYNDLSARTEALNKALADIMARVDAIKARPAENEPARFSLIHINGRPGVGKKTIAKALARMIDGTVVDNHTLLNPGNAACGRRSEGYYRISRAVRQAVFDELAHEIKHRPVILTNTLTDQVGEHHEIHEEIKLLARKAQAPLVEVVLTAAFEENARRLETRSRRAFLKLTDKGELSRLYNLYTIITPQDAIVIDTTALKPGDSARLIRDHVVPQQKKASQVPEIIP